MIEGLTTEEATLRSQLYGKNSVMVEIKPIWKLIVEEVENCDLSLVSLCVVAVADHRSVLCLSNLHIRHMDGSALLPVLDMRSPSLNLFGQSTTAYTPLPKVIAILCFMFALWIHSRCLCTCGKPERLTPRKLFVTCCIHHLIL